MPFARDYWLAEQGSFTQSDSLGETALVAIYPGDDLEGALGSVAVRPNSTVSADLLKARFLGADVTEYGDTTSCFAALADGRARSVVIPVTALDAVHEQNDLSGYKTSELPGTVSLAVWMRQDDPMLLTIVNKGIANAKENLIAGTLYQRLLRREGILARQVRAIPPDGAYHWRRGGAPGHGVRPRLGAAPRARPRPRRRLPMPPSRRFSPA